MLEGMLNYLKENNSPFSMPGHEEWKGLYETEVKFSEIYLTW